MAKLVATLLAGIGFNTVLPRLGIGYAPAEGQRTPSQIVGWVMLVAIMVFAVMGAASLLGWTALTLLLSEFVMFSWHIIVGLIVFGLGLWLADVIAKMIIGIEHDPEAAGGDAGTGRDRWRCRSPSPCARWGWRTRSSISPSA